MATDITNPTTLLFGPWEPDAQFLNSRVLAVATNIIPAPAGWKYIPGASTISSVTPTAPLTGGVVIQTTSAGAYSLYYGTTNIIRRIDSSALNTATTITTSTQPTAPALWRFAKFGTKLIAAHAGVDPLYEDWTAAATAMSTLGGSPPRASGVFAVGDFVFLTGLASNARKLQWSAISDAEGWTVGTGLSDEQEFPDGGDIFGIAGDKFGYVIQQNAIRTFQFLPGDTATIFSFNKVPDVPGAVGPNAWATAGNTLFYYSEEGFCSIGPGGFKRIGAHRVDEYFRASSRAGLNPSYTKAVADPYNTRVYFSYDRLGDGSADSAIVYDWLLDKWGGADVMTAAFMFEHLDATGGGAQIFHTISAISRLSGASSTAVVTLPFIELRSGKRSLVTAVRPMMQATSFTELQIDSREKINGSATTATSSTEETNGRFSFSRSGAYHSFTVTASGSGFIAGLQVWSEPAGEA